MRGSPEVLSEPAQTCRESYVNALLAVRVPQFLLSSVSASSIQYLTACETPTEECARILQIGSNLEKEAERAIENYLRECSPLCCIRGPQKCAEEEP